MSDHVSWELYEATGHFRGRMKSDTWLAVSLGILPVLLFGCKVDHLAEEISKQSVEGAAWFLLLLIVKCKRKEFAVICLEAEDCQQPQKPRRGQEGSESLQRAQLSQHFEFELPNYYPINVSAFSL